MYPKLYINSTDRGFEHYSEEFDQNNKEYARQIYDMFQSTGNYPPSNKFSDLLIPLKKHVDSNPEQKKIVGALLYEYS
jgi:hypothetical protein